MWDLDSDDGDGLTSGGDIPCPECATRAFFEYAHENLATEVPTPGEPSPAERWEDLVRWRLKAVPAATMAALKNPFNGTILDWKTRAPSSLPVCPDAPGCVERSWPWSMNGLSNHQLISLM